MKPIAVTLGDPAGIGSEVVFKALEEISSSTPVWIFGDWNWARQSITGSQLPALKRVTGLPYSYDRGETRLFIDIAFSDSEPVRFGSIEPAYGQAALDSIQAALESIDQGHCGSLVNAPIHKQSIALAGSEHTGHTELLAAHYGLDRYAYDYAMYFDSPTIRVALLSVHISLADAIRQVSAEKVAALARLVHREYTKIYGAPPRIAAAGINPHAGEGGIMGDEDEIVEEGVALAMNDGVSIVGPLAPDTIFLSASRGKFDVVIAAYHDQGLIPVKTMHFERSVNVTLGLPFLRASVDHGTAFDIAGKGMADAAPMAWALEWTARYAEKFRR
ncbi:MAG TPA: 4-hydroxythreonine-4-phosphate dehydrogenase PdxA [Thermoanaerobaculia bacterium]